MTYRMGARPDAPIGPTLARKIRIALLLREAQLTSIAYTPVIAMAVVALVIVATFLLLGE